MLAPETVTVIDIETTGLEPATGHITEIAAIRAEVGADGSIREIGRFQTFVGSDAGVVVPPEISELTGIRTEDLRGAPSMYVALTALWHFARGSVWVAHNAPFDFSFIAKVYNNNDQFACTRAMARLVDPDESASLKDVCPRYGIELSGQHRAMNDVEATLRLYAKLREKAEINGISYQNVVVDSDERPLKYVPQGAIIRTIKKTKEAV
ncbi:3'-5' exonuclease [Paenibacillus sp. FSL M7-1455]|uniref:3'-5' exonuclease n=1 Tax=Paenibacillus sp. FSL M7-1455 TaxID=2975316 RepID=UPI0030F81F49